MSTAIPLSITWTWRVSGEFDTSVLSSGTTYEVQLPLTLNRSTRDGWVNPLTLDLEPPQGAKPPPNTVYPASLPVEGQFKDFPFPSFTAQGSGKIHLTASTTQSHNLPSALIVANGMAKIKGTQFTIPLSISWTWTVSGQVQGEDLKQGSTYEIVHPLMLKGVTYDGWSDPLTLQLQLPPGDTQPPPSTVYPKSIPLENYKDFAFPRFVAHGKPGPIQITATTAQAANLLSSLLIANEKAKIMEV